MDDYLEILKRYDEDVPYLDMPADRSVRLGLTDDFSRLHAVLEEQLGLSFKKEVVDYQEPAWYGSLWIVKDAYGRSCPGSHPDTHTSVALTVKVSNFGRLTTICGCDEEMMSTYPVEEIRRHIVNLGFRYIPVEVLVMPYNGDLITENRFKRKYTWFDRFFFYPS